MSRSHDSFRRPARLNLNRFEERLAPAAFTVTNNNDAGSGSLRAALTSANGNPDADSIAFDLGVFSSPQVITLLSPLPTITRTVSIIGTKADNCIIDGNGTYSLLKVAHLTTESPIAVSINAVSFRHGSAIGVGGLDFGADNVSLQGCRVYESYGAFGGIKLTGGTLTLQDCEISGNTSTYAGGALYMTGASASASVTARRCTFALNSVNYTGSGGAINVAAGNLSLENCTISNNMTGKYGGGLYVVGTATVTHCTIYQNSATSGGGMCFTGSVTMTDTIMSGNTSSSAGPDAFGDVLTLDHSAIGNKSGFTVMDKGGNIYGATLNLAPLSNNGGLGQSHALAAGSAAINAGSTIAGFTADQRSVTYSGTPDIGAFESVAPAAVAGAIGNIYVSTWTIDIPVTYSDEMGLNTSTIGYGDVRVTGPNGFSVLAAFNNFTPAGNGLGGTANYYVDPPSGGWSGDNNGTYTASIEPGQVLDQHGLAVPAGSLGTVVVLFSRSIVVTTLADSGPGSLRQAAIDADTAANGLPDTISFAAGLTGTITLTTGEIATYDSLFIVGPGPSVLTISGGNSTRIFNRAAATNPTVFTVSGLTLANGAAGGAGAAIRMGDETLELTNCVLSDNHVASNFGGGGAVAFTQGKGGTLTITDCTFTGNSADAGGAIFMNAPTAKTTITRSTFSNNSALSGGGAIYVTGGGSLVINDSALFGNVTTGTGTIGGGVYFDGVVSSPGFSIRNSTFSGNTSKGDGAAVGIYSIAGSFYVQNSTITSNTANGANGGGGIARSMGTGTIWLESSIVSNNLAPNSANKDLYTLGTVEVKSCGVSTKSGVTTYHDNGGNVTIGADLKLGALADNGGPTKTHALLLGSPAIDFGYNPTALNNDQRGGAFVRTFGKNPDIGAYEAQSPPPTVVSVVVNDGSVQRSMVTKLTVTLSEPVAIVGGLTAAFKLARTGPGSPAGSVDIAAIQSGAVVTITFLNTGPVGIDAGGSLLDGVYQLTVVASKVSGIGGTLDGDGNGTAGDNYFTPITGAGRLFRLFGDSDGDGSVAANDFIQFRLALGGSNPIFDFDGDGAVAASDFIQFRLRFGGSI